MTDTIRNLKKENYAGKRKHRSSKKDIAKSKNERKCYCLSLQSGYNTMGKLSSQELDK